MQPTTKCTACGIINISKYVNNFLRTNRTTLILSSLVSEFDQESKSEFFLLGGGGGGGRVLKPKQFARLGWGVRRVSAA